MDSACINCGNPNCRSKLNSLPPALAAVNESMMALSQAGDVLFWPSHKLLERIVGNIATNPKDDKFRKISLSNPKFHENVWKVPGAPQFLFTMGFTEEDGNLVFPATADLAPLQHGLKQLQDAEGIRAYLKKQAAAQHRAKLAAESDMRQALKEQISCDRAETAQKETRDAKANKIIPGAQVMRFSDIGVNVNKQGGG